MSIVTKLPNVSAQSIIIEPSSVDQKVHAWHGDIYIIYIQMGSGENGRKTCRWLCVFYKTNVGLGLRIWGGHR